MRKGLISVLVASLLVAILATIAVTPVSAKKPDGPPGQDKKNGGSDPYPEYIYLKDIDSGLTSPTGEYRWLDVANQAYSISYKNSYDYTQATVKVSFAPEGETLEGKITAQKLKPNFAYQVKLAGYPETDPDANERIGLAGRWWQEWWDGDEWEVGNLNTKCNTSPCPVYPEQNPNDLVYFSNIGDPDYRYSGYMAFDYFITDSKGNASLTFQVDSSYHVLWKTTQRGRTSSDGPIKQTTFRVNPKKSPAYSTRYPETSVSIFGEWERLPVGGIFLAPGSYDCEFFLTEESFHGDGGIYAGNWAAAMGAPISFTITD